MTLMLVAMFVILARTDLGDDRTDAKDDADSHVDFLS